jgi:hypothetical protein
VAPHRCSAGCEADAASFVEDVRDFSVATEGLGTFVLEQGGHVVWGPKVLQSSDGAFVLEASFQMAKGKRYALTLRWAWHHA